MMTIYKAENRAWNRIGELSPVDYDTDKEIAKGIKKLESRYLFSHHDYMVKSADRTIHFENGKIQEF